MKRFQRILVPLRLSGEDETIVRHAAMVARVSEAARVYFAHVAEDFEIPASVRAELPDDVPPLDEQARADMVALVEAHFEGAPGTEVRYDVQEGAELVSLLRLARRKAADLVIVGRGNARDRDEAVLPVKLARKAPCSVLVLPSGAPTRFERVLVPVDFSERSRDALEAAVAFAHAFADPVAPLPLEVLHVFGVPGGYARLARSHAEVAAVIRDGAEAELRAFVAGSDLRGLAAHPILEEDNRASDGILDTIAYVRPDLVVLSTRGRTDSAAVLLGSTCERVIQRAGVPVLAVKRSGEARTLLDILLSHE